MSSRSSGRRLITYMCSNIRARPKIAGNFDVRSCTSTSSPFGRSIHSISFSNTQHNVLQHNSKWPDTRSTTPTTTKRPRTPTKAATIHAKQQTTAPPQKCAAPTTPIPVTTTLCASPITFRPASTSSVEYGNEELCQRPSVACGAVDIDRLDLHSARWYRVLWHTD